MAKLNPETLTVSSFETSPVLKPQDPLTTLTDPTAATFCYWCPPETVSDDLATY